MATDRCAGCLSVALRRVPALEWQDWANPILEQPFEVKAGKLHIPKVPGVGLEWDEKVVAAHLADNF